MANLENFRLTVFRAVAAHLSFRKAADALYLTQPAVSSQIKALEDDLGIQLFDRGHGRIALTEAGSLLLDFAGRSQTLFAQAAVAIAALKGESSGVLALGASTTIAQYALPHKLGEFCARNRGVEIKMFSGNTEQVVEDLLARRISLGLIEGPSRSSQVHVEPYLSDELVLIVPGGHEWAERETVTVKELPSIPFLMRERGSGTRDVILQALERRAIHVNDLRIAMELDSTEAIKSAVAAGLGAGFVSRWALRQDSRAGNDFTIVALAGLRILRSFFFVSLHGQQLQGVPAEFRRFLLADLPGLNSRDKNA